MMKNNMQKHTYLQGKNFTDRARQRTESAFSRMFLKSEDYNESVRKENLHQVRQHLEFAIGALFLNPKKYGIGIKFPGAGVTWPEKLKEGMLIRGKVVQFEESKKMSLIITVPYENEENIIMFKVFAIDFGSKNIADVQLEGDGSEDRPILPAHKTYAHITASRKDAMARTRITELDGVNCCNGLKVFALDEFRLENPCTGMRFRMHPYIAIVLQDDDRKMMWGCCH
ncbi:MAG: hypothetical protein NTX79_02655 [Candidatus Micrarchaeota archaeon]|nr:hypothetical protein [Candidatus Micrarchaeota archaeon]